jgi:NAD(P) transhydrogenase subunit alpha
MSSAEPSSVIVGVPRERVPGERRVALVPDVVSKLTGEGVSLIVESGAGREAFYDDAAYVAAGAEIAPDAATLFRRANLIAKVQPPGDEEIALLPAGGTLLSFLDPARNADVVERLVRQNVTALSFNTMPRITRAQTMDAMSSMSTVAGYKAVLLAADSIGRFFPLLMTAAGTVPPARVLVLGAGVAGLQALATARRLGAVTEAFDTRPAVREQVQSVGASFVEMAELPTDSETAGGYAREMDEDFIKLERDAIREAVARADVVITTAMVPGKRAPILIDEEMVATMRSGSVIVDLAAESGGNCALTAPGDTMVVQGVTIIGPLNLASCLPTHASSMYSRNVAAVIKHIVTDGALRLDPEDEIVRAACVTGVLEVSR